MSTPIEMDSFFLLSAYLTGAISREDYLRRRAELEKEARNDHDGS